MGAVMGSKLLKAIVVKGSRPIPQAFPAEMKALGRDDLRAVHALDQKSAWSKQGTTGVLAWCNEVAALPVNNFRQTHHPEAWKVDGERLAAAKVAVYGCPNCTMQCGIAIHDTRVGSRNWTTRTSACSAPTWASSTTAQVATLNYMCDDYGIDTETAGATLSFYADAVERGAATGDLRFGDFAGFERALTAIAHRDGPVGDLLADGPRRQHGSSGTAPRPTPWKSRASQSPPTTASSSPAWRWPSGSAPSAPTTRSPGSSATRSSRPARESYGRDKAQKVVDLQRIRGGMFEAIVSCRFPWIEVGWGLESYPKYFNAITGRDWALEDFWPSSDRIYALMKLFWLREFPDTDRKADYPPHAWFDPANADTEGPIAGRILEYDKYDALLQHYYDIRGYDRRGIPTRETLEHLGLGAEAKAAEEHATLT